jgi:glycerophosphoryl diester phosphodiesterase
VLRRLWPAHLPIPLLSSFHYRSLATARDAAPEFPRAFLVDTIEDDWQRRAESLAAVGINTNGRKLDPGHASAIKAADFLLAVYTINDPQLARELVSHGADCIITDSPDIIAEAIGA